MPLWKHGALFGNREWLFSPHCSSAHSPRTRACVREHIRTIEDSQGSYVPGDGESGEALSGTRVYTRAVGAATMVLRIH